MQRRGARSQRGSVIIVTLWTITLLTILITAIAAQNRLSARAAFYHLEELRDWANVLAAVNQAEMELLLETMPRPPEDVEDLAEIGRNPLYRYNGQELELEYPAADGLAVRIYDHAGKINLRELEMPLLRALLEKQMGDVNDREQRLEELLAAWRDWIDLNEAETVNGADTDYYMSLDTPYTPRNGRIETVEEILSIRGFDEIFADVDLDAAFTIYPDRAGINLNLATVEAMRLLPGLDDELIEEIVAYRQENEFRGNGDVALIVPAENMAVLRQWLDNRKVSNFYTIMAYPQTLGPIDEAEAEGLDPELLPEVDVSTNAYAEVVQIRSYTEPPRVLKINPYATIPIRLHLLPEDE